MSGPKPAIRIAKEFIATIEALQTVPGMHASYEDALRNITDEAVEELAK